MTELSTAEICVRFRGMYVPAVTDAMYELGMCEQVLPSALRPLFPERSFVGIAFTVEGVEIVPPVSWEEGTERIASYLEAFEEITPDSVLVSKNTGNLVGHFGELTGNTAMEHGCVGVVLDGNLRDSAGVREIGLQVFYRDVNPLSGIGRWEMIAHQEPVTIGAVTVHPGDLVIADFDGIAVVPKSDILTVLSRAEEIVTRSRRGSPSMRSSPSSTARRQGPAGAVADRCTWPIFRSACSERTASSAAGSASQPGQLSRSSTKRALRSRSASSVTVPQTRAHFMRR